MSGTEAARVRPEQEDPPSHAAFTRLLHRREPDPDTLWAVGAPLVRRDAGILVLDDRTLDKPDARKIGLLLRHYTRMPHLDITGSAVKPPYTATAVDKRRHLVLTIDTSFG